MIMKNGDVFLESADLYRQASKLIRSTMPLQHCIQTYNAELIGLIRFDNTPFEKKRIHDLKDEIFSCEIEIQALQLRADRLLKQAHSQHYTNV
jgi:hypothetical protein